MVATANSQASQALTNVFISLVASLVMWLVSDFKKSVEKVQESKTHLIAEVARLTERVKLHDDWIERQEQKGKRR